MTTRDDGPAHPDGHDPASPSGDPETVTYTDVQVSNALNGALTDIEDALELTDDRTVDALNLLLNVSMAYLRGVDNLEDAIARSYETDTDEVLSWVS